MLDPKVTELARTMIQVQFDERRKQLQRDIELIHNDIAERGMGRSGVTFSRVYELCAHEVEVRAFIIWQVLFRVLSTVGAFPSEELSRELKAELEAYLPADLPELTQILERNAEFVQLRSIPSFADARNHALKKVDAEIDLFAHSIQSRAPGQKGKADPSPVVQHFYSPVGVVQTGSGAVASVAQTFTAQDREGLIRALGLVSQSLAAIGELASYPKEEVQELVREAQSEVEKTKPNGTRLRTILTAVATAIQTAGSVQPAYQTLKAALLPLGIFLP